MLAVNNNLSAISKTYLDDNMKSIGNNFDAKYLPAEEYVYSAVPNTDKDTKPAYIKDVNYENVNQYETKQNIDNKNNTDNPTKNTDKTEKNTDTKNVNEPTKANGDKLSNEERETLSKLKVIDSKVRQHEQAHVAVAGGLVKSGPNYSYQTGPDGKQYAIGGEVNIDTGTEKTPTATIAKMGRVIAAAMAPADPSNQDHGVAAAARQIISEMKNQASKETFDNSQAQNNQTQNKTNTPQQTPTPSLPKFDTTPTNTNTTTDTNTKANTDKSSTTNKSYLVDEKRLNDAYGIIKPKNNNSNENAVDINPNKDDTIQKHILTPSPKLALYQKNNSYFANISTLGSRVNIAF
jgi:hypothetical protein